MKPLRMDFARPRAWVGPWFVFGLASLLLAGFAARELARLSEEKAAIKARLLAAAGTSRVPGPSSPEPRKVNAAEVARLLSSDVNRAFAVAESVQVKDGRLVNIELDVAAGFLRFEYEVRALADVAAITQSLNAGYESRPFQLESARTSASQIGGVGTGPETTRAAWVANLRRL